MFTVLPTTVSCMRDAVPMLPTIAGPMWIPMPWANGGRPRADRVALCVASARCIARAVRTAFAASWPDASPAPNTTMIASPMNLSMMPPSPSMAAIIASR